ncbi:MAG: TetR/AcrR family transcriptional regulator [Alphaproteobacteria bacterium]
MKRAEKREHLIDVAAELFNRLGYHAAGVDQVIAEAGIAKTTLYRHFGSKEDLIVAVLKRMDEQFRNDMRAAVETSAKAPRDKLLATFDFLEGWFEDKAFYGCPFISAAGEYGERRSPVFHAAAMHKRLMVAYFEELARAAGLKEPSRLAEEINLLQEGAIAVAHITGDPKVAARAKAVAARLIEAAGEAA